MPTKNLFIDFPIFQVPEYQVPGNYVRGENQKKAMVILSSDEDTEDLNTFLTKILSAVKLDFHKDILLLSVPADEQIHLNTIVKQENIQVVIVFGIPPKQLGIHLSFALYQPISLGSFNFLFAHPLAEIFMERQKGGKQKAGALWRELQRLFV